MSQESLRIANTLRNFFELATDLFLTCDQELVIQTVNPMTEEVLGYSADELIGQPFARFIHADDVSVAKTAASLTFEGKELFNYHCRMVTKAGEDRWIRFRARTYDARLFAIGTDVTAERQTKLKLEEANRLLSNALRLEREWRAMAEVQQLRFRDLFNQVPMIAAVYTGPNQIIELANPFFYQLVNFRNIMGQSVHDALPMLDETTLSTLRRVYTTGQRFVGRNFRMQADWNAVGVASEKSFHLIFEPIKSADNQVEAIWCLAFDVSETVALEHKLRAAERMSSLGEMAASIGHEINNPLAYSLLNLDLLSDKLGVEFGAREQIPVQLSEHLRKSVDGLDRVRDIVKGLKSFSRQDESSVEPLDVCEPLRAAIEFTSNELRHRAGVTVDFKDVPRVVANAGRLTQVFTNLLVNAAQALDAGKANENTIHVSVSKGEYDEVYVDIRDSGCGIPPDRLARVFEPFFTLKPVGVGTGLGLSICHGIISSFGGRIEIESEVGRGTRVRVALPATNKTVTPRVTPSFKAAEPPVHTRKRILVIDDDKSLRDVLQAALEGEHDVVALESAVDALEHLDVAREPYDWVICDVMMPAMTGMEFFETIRARGTGFEKKIILMTGGAFTPKIRTWMESLPNPKLDKPFRIKQLKELLEK
jgi:PAS domain S-box-containing protein